MGETHFGTIVAEDGIRIGAVTINTVIANAVADALADAEPVADRLYLSPEMYGNAGAGNDDTAFFAAMKADLIANPKVATVRLRATTYIVPNGFTESIRGLRVIGSGQCDFGPTTVGNFGTWIKTTAADAWCWLHSDGDSATNVYDGITFEGVGFYGDADTAGGLRIYTNGNRVMNCVAYGSTTGVGFHIGINPGGFGTDDASWNYLFGCMAQDNLGGYLLDGPDAGTDMVACDSHKTNQGGIVGTGYGAKIAVGNVSVVASKMEGSAIGWHITAPTGVTLGNCRAEGNGDGYVLDRGQAFGYGSRIILTGCTASGSTSRSIYIGANQLGDRLIAFLTPDGGIVNDGASLRSIASDPITSGSGTVTSDSLPMPE